MIVNIAHLCVTARQRVPLWRCLTLMYGILKQECRDFPKTSQALQNSSASRVPRRKYYTEDFQLLDATVQNSDARATRRPRFARRWLRNYGFSFLCITRPYKITLRRTRRCREKKKKGREYACDGVASRFCFSTVRILDQGSLLGMGRPLLRWQLDECWVTSYWTTLPQQWLWIKREY